LRALEAVGLGHRAHHLPSELSGGEQQRVAIARALINDPAVILADEPTGNLDATSGGEILGILRRLVESGRTLVMVTHDPGVAGHADRILRFAEGRIVGDERVTSPATVAPVSHP
jgi:putative ABC transport system ATP-binding protein